MARKGEGQAAKLSFAGHVLMENRNGLVVDVVLSQATGTAEMEAVLTMLERVPTARRHGRGRQGVRHAGVRDHLPLVRDHASRGYEATALSPGPADEPSCGVRGESAGAKRVEEVFGWLKTVGGGRKLRYCGVARNGLWPEMALAAYNLVRMAKLMPPPSSSSGAVPAC